MKRLCVILIVLVSFINSQAVFGDDTELFDASIDAIPPNVVIIFDNSGSMNEQDVYQFTYDPTTTYAGPSSYVRDRVYQDDGSGTITEYRPSGSSITPADINCDRIRRQLINAGSAWDSIDSSTNCGGNQMRLRTGNFLNYVGSGASGVAVTRLLAAKTAIAGTGTDPTNPAYVQGILRNPKYANIRFGLVALAPTWAERDEGAHILQQCGATTTDLRNSVWGLAGQGGTQLAEALSDVGCYLAGQQTWITGHTYDDPGTLPCRNNYVIIMTDGLPHCDTHPYLSGRDNSGNIVNYLGIKPIGDYDNDNKNDDIVEPTYDNCAFNCDFRGYIGWNSGQQDGPLDLYGTDYLDDVALFLRENDIRPSWPQAGTTQAGWGPSGESYYLRYPDQNVQTYTIGLRIDIPLLEDTANHGTGQYDGSGYFTTNTYQELEEAFDKILNNVLEVNGTYIAPVVPISRNNRTLSSNYLYVGLFKPRNDGRWYGNVKKFGLDDEGNMVMPNGAPLTEDGWSYWSKADCKSSVAPNNNCSGTGDGWNVEQGGVGGAIRKQANGDAGYSARNLYTYMGSNVNLTDSSNVFTLDGNRNTAIISNSVLGLGAGETTTGDDIVEFMYEGSGESDWIMGDVIHSRPLVVHYDLLPTPTDGKNDTSYIYVSTNGGIMHCIADDDGQELWGFIPPDYLSRLKNLTDDNNEHAYFADGVPAIHGATKTLIFGERRGGSKYYALDVLTPSAPQWKYEVGPGILSGETLGQSWCVPKVGKIKTGSGESAYENVFILGGGYDIDQDTGPGIDDTGRAVFAINVETGSVVSQLNFNASQMGSPLAFGSSIVDVTPIDWNGNKIIDRIYAGDMGGHIFAMEDISEEGVWSLQTLFTAKSNMTETVTRKIFYAPDVTRESFNGDAKGDDFIFFGTGNRADPSGETDVVNRIYAVRNVWNATTFGMDETDLHDATDNDLKQGDATERANAAVELGINTDTNGAAVPNEKNGWYIRLENPGEKVVSNTLVYGGIVYFTTYQPSPTPPVYQGCDLIGEIGYGRLYALDYKTGVAAYDWNDTVEYDGEGSEVDPGEGKLDRSKIISSSIPSAPVLAIFKGQPKIYVATSDTGDGDDDDDDDDYCNDSFTYIKKECPPPDVRAHLFYWMQNLSY